MVPNVPKERIQLFGNLLSAILDYVNVGMDALLRVIGARRLDIEPADHKMLMH